MIQDVVPGEVDLNDLEIEELEQRLEMAAVSPISPNFISVGVGISIPY